MADENPTIHVVVTKNGPYQVTGAESLVQEVIGTDAQGMSVKWIDGQTVAGKAKMFLCRCGHSANKPFCDGTHLKIGFDGTETASRESYLSQAQVFDGPVMELTDVQALCAFARFCDPHGQVWSQVSETDDPEIRAQFVKQVGDCPSGRLVAWDKDTGKPVEPDLPLSIGLIEDPSQNCSGPLWLRGGISVESSDGFTYERRNRVTLCRCGASRNKPFCDGSHASIGFQDDIA